jgi:hypothetical protein
MRGIPYGNFPAFAVAAETLRAAGYIVFSPAENDLKIQGNPYDDHGNCVDEVFDIRRALADDCEYLTLHADAICMLPGWENSKGAKAEKALAEALGLEVMYLT